MDEGLLRRAREDAALMEQMFGVRLVHVCVFCGAQMPDAGEVAQHIRDCEEHPGVRLPRG